MAEKQEVWVSPKVALSILRGNSGRQDIPESYIRTLAKLGKVAKRPSPVDTRANEYLLSDIEDYQVKRRDGSKGDTRAARTAGSRRKSAREQKTEKPAA